jgi:tRNA threonylcarbamoyladenosine biosynthesis protein TsaE
VTSALTIDLPNLSASQVLGTALGQQLWPGTVLLLQGNLGSGKTTLIQYLGRALGITDEIVSPTFTLANEYPEGRLPLYHLDLYRLEPAEVIALHPEHYWQEAEFPPGIVAIEWPERLLACPAPCHPPTYLHLSLYPHPDSQCQGEQAPGRRVELIPVGGFELGRLQF